MSDKFQKVLDISPITLYNGNYIMKKEDEYNYFEDILWIILIVLLLLAVGYYAKYYYNTYMNNQLLR